jgi:uncharacterized small protein (DUF1192 family)
MGYHCWACKRPFDADSGPDPDTVWYATGTVDSGPTNVYHTDRDCYRLDRADEVRTIAREDLAEPWTQCRTCAGRDEAGHGAYETLLEADPEEFGDPELVTDGGQPLEDLGRDELVERVEALRNDVEALTAERVTLRTRAQRMALGARVVAIVASGLGAAVTAYLVSVYGTAAWRAALLATGLVVVAWGLSIGVRVGVATLREGSA